MYFLKSSDGCELLSIWLLLWISHSKFSSVFLCPASCELLSIWLLLWISHSYTVSQSLVPIVVNCFQFDYFCGYHTAIIYYMYINHWLWIAFNLITFVDITQLKSERVLFMLRCELLSIWLLLWISHSNLPCYLKIFYVVNCFQFDYFCGYHTASTLKNIYIKLLWIAFNLITFVDITQLRLLGNLKECRCELLSIWLLLWISHSSSSLPSVLFSVVNCFQFDYFCGYHTAR